MNNLALFPEPRSVREQGPAAMAEKVLDVYRLVLEGRQSMREEFVIAR